MTDRQLRCLLEQNGNRTDLDAGDRRNRFPRGDEQRGSQAQRSTMKTVSAPASRIFDRASSFSALVGIAVDVVRRCFPLWNHHPEPSGSRRATPLLLFQHRAGQFRRSWYSLFNSLRLLVFERAPFRYISIAWWNKLPTTGWNQAN